MATVTGVTAERMQEILDEAVETASIEGSTLIFTRHDGSSFAAGDFANFIGADVAAEVAVAVPAAVSGGVTAKGSISGTMSFTGLTAAQMVNRLFTATLAGNLIVNSASFPSNPIPGTQFAIIFKQDATGGRTLTLTGIKRSQGVLALSAAANATDIVSFMYDGATWYAGLMGVNFS